MMLDWLFCLLFLLFQEGPGCIVKSDGLKRGFQSMDSSDCHMDEVTSGKPKINLGNAIDPYFFTSNFNCIDMWITR